MPGCRYCGSPPRDGGGGEQSGDALTGVVLRVRSGAGSARWPAGRLAVEVPTTGRAEPPPVDPDRTLGVPRPAVGARWTAMARTGPGGKGAAEVDAGTGLGAIALAVLEA